MKAPTGRTHKGTGRMATYIAHSQRRETITLMLSKAEADALGALAAHAYDEGGVEMNGQTKAAANRAIDALNASTNISARRAGFFET